MTQILRSHGYINNPTAQPDGTWTTEAAKEFNGRKITVVVDGDGNMEEKQRAAPTDSHP